MEATDFSIIEENKENIPLSRGGKSFKILSEVFTEKKRTQHENSDKQQQIISEEIENIKNTSLNDQKEYDIATNITYSSENGLENKLAEYEKRISELDLKEEDDPLELYYEYCKLRLEINTKGEGDEGLIRTLESSVKKFLGYKQYRDDIRYLKLWLWYIKYIRENKETVYKYMFKKGIGQNLALFYEEMARFYCTELVKYDKADKIYCIGIERKAQPLQRLKTKYQNFIKYIGSKSEGGMQVDSNNDQRNGFGGSGSGSGSGSGNVNLERKVLGVKVMGSMGGIARSVDSNVLGKREYFPMDGSGGGGGGGSSIGTSNRERNGGKLRVLMEESNEEGFLDEKVEESNENSVENGGDSWKEIGTDKSRRKENIAIATQWKGIKLETQKSNSDLASYKRKKFKVFQQDEEEENEKESGRGKENERETTKIKSGDKMSVKVELFFTNEAEHSIGIENSGTYRSFEEYRSERSKYRYIKWKKVDDDDVTSHMIMAKKEIQQMFEQGSKKINREWKNQNGSGSNSGKSRSENNYQKEEIDEEKGNKQELEEDDEDEEEEEEEEEMNPAIDNGDYEFTSGPVIPHEQLRDKRLGLTLAEKQRLMMTVGNTITGIRETNITDENVIKNDEAPRVEARFDVGRKRDGYVYAKMSENETIFNLFWPLAEEVMNAMLDELSEPIERYPGFVDNHDLHSSTMNISRAREGNTEQVLVSPEVLSSGVQVVFALRQNEHETVGGGLVKEYSVVKQLDKGGNSTVFLVKTKSTETKTGEQEGKAMVLKCENKVNVWEFYIAHSIRERIHNQFEDGDQNKSKNSKRIENIMSGFLLPTRIYEYSDRTILEMDALCHGSLLDAVNRISELVGLKAYNIQSQSQGQSKINISIKNQYEQEKYIDGDNGSGAGYSGNFYENVALLVLGHVIEIVTDLHSVGIVHTDIRCENLLINVTQELDELVEKHKRNKVIMKQILEQMVIPSDNDEYENMDVSVSVNGNRNKLVKLIDFGRCVDITRFNPNQYLQISSTSTSIKNNNNNNKNEDENNDEEENVPIWTPQADIYAIAKIACVMLFRERIKVNTVTIEQAKRRIKRYWHRDLWIEFFDLVLSIPDTIKRATKKDENGMGVGVGVGQVWINYMTELMPRLKRLSEQIAIVLHQEYLATIDQLDPEKSLYKGITNLIVFTK